MTVNVQATFKKDEREFNGLEGAREDFITKPLERRTIVATVEVTTITRDIRDGGTETPTVRLVTVEVLAGDDAMTARKLLDAAYNGRTGQVAPPPSLFDPDMPDDAAQVTNDQPWDEREGDDNTDPPADGDGAPKRGRRK